MGHYILDNAVIYTEQGKIENGYIEIQDGYIQDIQEGSYSGNLEVVDVNGQHIIPGFIDIHIHGDMVRMQWMQHRKH